MSPPHRVSPRKVGWVGAPCSALPFASSPLLTPKIPGSPPAPFQHPQPLAAVPTCAGKEGWRPAALCADSRTAPQRRFCLLACPGLQCSPSQRPPWGGRGQMSQQPPPALGRTDGRGGGGGGAGGGWGYAGRAAGTWPTCHGPALWPPAHGRGGGSAPVCSPPPPWLRFCAQGEGVPGTPRARAAGWQLAGERGMGARGCPCPTQGFAALPVVARDAKCQGFVPNRPAGWKWV